MKSSQDTSSSSSCTSSLFRSESERTSFIRIVRDRSRVDKFYIEKYVPLRERKLLTKLIKTRVIFDDIKKKLLSSSNISDDEKANLSRGFNVGPRHLSGFCSCCSCSTDFSIQGRTNKIGRHYENIHQPGATGKLRINTNYPAANARRQGSHIPYESGEYAKSRSSILKIKKHKTFPVSHSQGKSVRLSSKDIRSTPCLCPVKLNDVIKNESKVVLQRKKKAQNRELHNELINECIEEENHRKSLKNNKDKQLSVKYYKKLKYSKSRIKSNMEERSQKSTRKIKQNKETLQDGAKKTCNKALEYDKKLFAGDIKTPVRNKNLASTENIKENSVLKFNESLLQKQEWKCEHEYDSEECDLDECLEIILLNKVRRATCDNEIQTDKKSTTSAQVQGSETINVAAPDPTISINIGPKKKENLLSWKNKIKSSIPVVEKQRNIKSMTNLQPTGSTNLIRPASTGTVNTMENRIQSKPQGTIVPQLKQNQIVRPRTPGSDSSPRLKPRMRFTSPDGLQLKQNRSKIEPKIIDFKMKPSNITNKENIVKSKRSTVATKLKETKYLKADRFGLKRCFCTLKLKAKRNQNKSNRSVGKSTTVQTEKLKRYDNSQFFNKIRQNECEPSFCVPDKCNPMECERQLKNRDSVRFDTDYSRRFTSDSTKFTSNTIFEKNKMNLPSSAKNKNATAGIIERNDLFLNLRRYIGKLKLCKSTNKKNVKVQSISKVLLCYSAVQVPNLCRHTFSKLTLKYTEKRLNTECLKAKSTSSITSRAPVPVNIKKVKSTLPAYKISPTLKLKKKVVIKQMPSKVKTTPEVVRKCLSLDPNILMNKTPLLLNAPIKKSKENVREHGSQGDAKLEKRSVFIQVDNQRKKARIGTVLKRCFCILKFNKRSKNEKSLKENKIIGTEPTIIKKLYTKNIETSTSTPKLRSSLKIIKTVKSSGMGTETNRLNDAFTKTSKSISNIEKVTLSNEMIDTNSRHAVRFGSSFSFDIEFYKNYSHEVQNTCNKKQDKSCVPKSSYINKIRKVFSIQPMLQRCFCSINRLKQNKYITKPKLITPVGHIKIQPNVYTVRRVAITENKIGDQIYSLYNYGDTTYEDDKISTLKQNYLVGNSPKKTITIKPNKQKMRRKWVIQNKKYIAFTKKNRHGTIIRQSGFQNEKIYKKGSRLRVNHSKITGFSTYSKRCYCTMNVQAQRDNRNKQKLLDYECEPGVCDPYPGECDPNVCIQLINKRLKKSKMAGTGTGRPVSSSSQSTTSSQERKLQSSVPHRTQKTRADRSRGGPTEGIQYKTAPSSPRRQMVRVGSSFSFNIEFAKDKAQSKQQPEPVERVVKPEKIQKEKPKKQKNMGTKGMKSNRNSRDSQSGILMADKGSSGAPGLKRCFCTLKLHKKAENIKVATNANQSTMTPPDKRKIIVRANAGQNTKSYKPRPILDPHECEPNICIPGECDPYECLERIKKRNKKYQNKGTESVGSRSTSSGTVPKRHKREQKVQSKKYRERKARGSAVSLEERPSRPVTNFAPTDRQVVRIGSSFSFNIEFYKDRTPNADHIQAAAAAVKLAKKEKPVKIPKTNKGFGVDKKLQSRDSQVYGTKMENRGTGMLKRCFCTLKLHKKGKFPIEEKQIIKVNTHGTKARRVKEPATMYERGATAHNKTELLPYECEPGICVPGQCDPYECYERIQRRLREAGTTTGRHDMRTASSMSLSALKEKKMQHGGRQKTHGKPTQARSVVEKEKRKKQAVRLGSDFSFNIEFYKDRSYDSSTVIKPPKTQYENLHYPKQKPHYAKRKPRPKVKRKTGSSQDQRSIRSTDSQVGKVMKNVGSTVTSLKRCFCTLSLKKPNQGPVIVNRLTNLNTIPQHFKPRKSRTLNSKTPVTIINRMNKLEPYECEPNFCIPGECDPLVCLERIKRRQKKNFGATTTGPGIKSVGSTGSISSTKGKGIQHKDHGKTKSSMGTSKTAKEYTPSSSSNKQTVRIGSNFSFDVEFCKEKSYGDSAGAPIFFSQKPYKGTRNIDASNSTDPNQKLKSKNIQKQKNVRDMTSQVLAKKMQSTMSGVSPLLKRCFCTLKLYSAKNNKTKPDTKKLKNPSPEQKKTSTKENKLKNHKNKKPETTKNSKVGTKAKEMKVIQPSPTSTKATRTAPVKYEKYPYKLEPYECEPGVCIPGECDPYECEKRIGRREMLSKMAGTEKKNRHSVSSITSGERRAKGGQTKYQTEKGTDSQTGDTESYVIEHSRFKSTGSPHRQAVRITSSFSFNVEFYKDSSPNFSNQVKPEAGDSTKQIMRHDNTDFKKLKNKNACNQAMCRDKGVCKQGICLRNRGLQANGPRTESRGSGVGPMLKRCFCTLKLQKKGTHGQKTVTKNNKKEIVDKKAKDVQIDKTDKKLKTANIGVSTKKKFGKLEPYECEPGICVPGECDPYECEKRIKQRNMKNLGTETSPGYKSIMACTAPCAKHTDKNLQSAAAKSQKDKWATAIQPKPISREPYSYSTSVREDSGRQAVRIGSSFSFEIELFKDRSLGSGPVAIPKQKETKPCKSPKCVEAKKLQSMQTKTVNRGCDSIKCQAKSQMTGANNDSKGTGMGPVLKRCFCTLKLQKSPNELQKHTKGKENKNKLKVKQTPQVETHDKKVATKKIKLHELSPYECEPYTCIPGKCDPYECLERIKKRNLRTETTGTKPFSQVAASCTAGTCPKSKKLQSSINDTNRIKQTQATATIKPVTLVEQPRFTKMNTNRQAVKIGSNFKFDIEFFKDSSIGHEIEGARKNYTHINKRDAGDNTNGKATKNKGMKNKSGNSKTCPTQAECLRTINQASGGDKILRRCFCTLKLQKQGNMRKAMTVQRVAVQYNKNIPYRHRIVNKSIKKKFINKNVLSSYPDMNTYACYPCKNCRKLSNTNWETDKNEIITLFPYIPHKFHNSVSKTLMDPINKKNKKSCSSTKEKNSGFNLRFKSSKACLLKNKLPTSIKKYQNFYEKNIKIYKGIHKEEEVEKFSSNGINIKKVFRHFKQILIKSRSSKKKTSISHPANEQSPEMHAVNMFKNNNSNITVQSKSSDRMFNPKVSKTMKFGKISETKYDCIYNSKYDIRAMKKETLFQPEDACATQRICVLQDKETKNVSFNNYMSSDHCQIKTSQKTQYLERKKNSYMDKKVVQQALVSYKNLDCCGYDICGIEGNIFCPCLIEKNVENKSQNTEMDSKKCKKNCAELIEHSLKPGILKKSKEKGNIASRTDKHIDATMLTTKTTVLHRPLCTMRSSFCQTKKVKFRKASDHRISNEHKREKHKEELKKIKRRSKSVTELPKPKGVNLHKKQSVVSKTTKFQCKSRKPCPCCRGNKEKNVSLAGGDQVSQSSKRNLLRKSCVQGCETKKFCVKNSMRCINFEKIKKRLSKSTDNCNKDPLFEMKLESKNMTFLNKDDVFYKIMELKSKKYKKLSPRKLEDLHGKTCRCCVCQSVKFGKVSSPGGILARFGSTKSCICGSAKCAEESETIARSKKKKKTAPKRKPCVCGTKICPMEALKIDLQNKIISKKQATQMRKKLKNETLTKKKSKKKTQDKRNYAMRQKKYKKEDLLRKKERNKADKIANRHLEKYMNSSDTLLLAESATDIAKLGINAVTSSLKCMCKAVLNPKHTYRNLRTGVQNPQRLLNNMKNVWSDSGVVSTARRVKRRFRSMRCVNSVANKMKENTVMNYLLHACDNNPTARLRRKRRVRRREPVNFQCSLYMASIRKKPWLFVYYLCPWFYPHCISMLNIWRQFTDVMLFLLAVFVWSPCILAMEACRACMCCTLCTG